MDVSCGQQRAEEQRGLFEKKLRKYEPAWVSRVCGCFPCVTIRSTSKGDKNRAPGMGGAVVGWWPVCFPFSYIYTNGKRREGKACGRAGVGDFFPVHNFLYF